MNDLEEGVPVRSYSRILRQRWRWIVLGAVLGLAVGTAAVVVIPKEYTATAVVNLDIISTAPFRSDRPASSLIDMQTEVQIAASWSTAVLAGEALGDGWEPGDMRTRTTVTTDGYGTIMRVSYADTSAARARAGADGIATAYLDVRREDAIARAEGTIKAIDERLQSLSGSLRTSLEQIAANEPGSAERTNAEAEGQLIRSEIDSLTSERTALFNLSSSAGRIITPASSSTLGVGPSLTVLLGAGLLGGLCLGLVLAFVRERAARHISSADELADLVTAPIWSPERVKTGDRWASAIEMFRYAAEGHRRVVVVATGEADTLARRFAEVTVDDDVTIELVAAKTMAEILAAARGADGLVLVVPARSPRSDLLATLVLLEGAEREVLGIVVEEPAPRGKRAADSAEEADE